MLISGDSLEELKRLDESSIDFICTDPPYGYSFMGKHWDKAVPSVELWRECLRVLKPGAFINVMSAPRSDVLSRMIVNIEDAGFRVDFTPIYWTYASGFPKAGNIGKMVDKRLGVQGEEYVREDFAKRSNKTEQKKSQVISGQKGVYHKVISDLDGSYAGFQPKPAVEVIIVAMKPLSEKTFVDQALKNGKGISWLDDCRVPTDNHPGVHKREGDVYSPTLKGKPKTEDSGLQPVTNGRFPANLLVSDDVLNDGQNIKGGSYSRQSRKRTGFMLSGSEDNVQEANAPDSYGDSGSYSRYFDLDKWASTLPFLIVPKASKSEKNKGLENREEVTVGDGPPVPIDNAFQRGKTERKNSHPTVKPLKLMSYLITLFTREGDIVLDPFCGSGTTCVAAKELNRDYIGIEREPEYVEIAEARIKATKEPEPQLL